MRKWWSERSAEWRKLVLTSAAVGMVHFLVMLGFAPAELVGDEERFLLHAENLTQGRYVSAEVPELATGPGYPLLLMPLVALEAPWWMMRGLNSFLVAGTMILLFQAGRTADLRRGAWIVVLLVGLNPVLFRYSLLMRVECLAVFLISGFLWALCTACARRVHRWQWMMLAGAFYFALIMSRVLFGYVAMAALVAVPALCWLGSHREMLRFAVAPFAMALFLSLPWMAYVKQQKGDWGWSSNGMELVYWMTSTGPQEYGNWLGEIELEERPAAAGRHGAVVSQIAALPLGEQEAAWSAAAKRNWTGNPGGIVKNLAANVSRAFFAFPRSYYQERLTTVCFVVCGAFALFSFAAAAYPWILGWEAIPLGLKISGLVGMIYLGGSLLLPVEPRYLLPLTPVLWIWVAFAFEKLVQIRFLRPVQDEADAQVEAVSRHHCSRFRDAA